MSVRVWEGGFVAVCIIRLIHFSLGSNSPKRETYLLWLSIEIVVGRALLGVLR